MAGTGLCKPEQLMKASPVNIHMPWGTMEGLHWARPGAAKVLCLHGWLDNAASFVPLAPFLKDFDLLALDFSGHGFSSHRPETSRYYFPDYIFDIDAAMHQLGWHQCHLIGHSMGGGVASCLAAALPERVDRRTFGFSWYFDITRRPGCTAITPVDNVCEKDPQFPEALCIG